MVAMSDTGNEAGAAGAESGPEGVDFAALEADVLSEMQGLKLLKSKSGWTAIVLPLNEMPGERVEATLGSMFSGGPVGINVIRASLDLMTLAVVESTETDGGARLNDLAFGEWLELLEQWTNG